MKEPAETPALLLLAMASLTILTSRCKGYKIGRIYDIFIPYSLQENTIY